MNREPSSEKRASESASTVEGPIRKKHRSQKPMGLRILELEALLAQAQKEIETKTALAANYGGNSVGNSVGNPVGNPVGNLVENSTGNPVGNPAGASPATRDLDGNQKAEDQQKTELTAEDFSVTAFMKTATSLTKFLDSQGSDIKDYVTLKTKLLKVISTVKQSILAQNPNAAEFRKVLESLLEDIKKETTEADQIQRLDAFTNLFLSLQPSSWFTKKEVLLIPKDNQPILVTENTYWEILDDVYKVWVQYIWRIAGRNPSLHTALTSQLNEYTDRLGARSGDYRNFVEEETRRVKASIEVEKRKQAAEDGKKMMAQEAAKRQKAAEEEEKNKRAVEEERRRMQAESERQAEKLKEMERKRELEKNRDLPRQRELDKLRDQKREFDKHRKNPAEIPPPPSSAALLKFKIPMRANNPPEKKDEWKRSPERGGGERSDSDSFRRFERGPLLDDPLGDRREKKDASEVVIPPYHKIAPKRTYSNPSANLPAPPPLPADPPLPSHPQPPPIHRSTLPLQLPGSRIDPRLKNQYSQPGHSHFGEKH